MWQQLFEKYGSEEFTVVGLALDAEGIAPAKLYYEKFGVTFPSLVDPDYATGFGAVPKTFFVDELFGCVLRGWRHLPNSFGDACVFHARPSALPAQPPITQWWAIQYF